MDDGTGTATFDFNNQSNNAAYYSWVFGDGNASSIANPVNTYIVSGVYTVYLTAYQSATCYEVFSQTINTMATSISQVNKDNKINAWINNNQLIVKGEDINRVEVRNVLGQTLFSSDTKNTFNLNGIATQTLIVVVLKDQKLTSTKLHYSKF